MFRDLYAAAEDAVQEAMLVVVRKYDQFAEGTSMLAWCRSIVRLEILRTRQRQSHDHSLADRLLHDAVDSAFDQFQTARRQHDQEPWQEALKRCLGKVPNRSLRVLRARFVDEMSYPEIADDVGMTLEAVRKALHRLKKQVRSCVQTRLEGAEY